MARDFEGEARRESEQDGAIKQWMTDRIKTIHETVSAFDVLERYGVHLRMGGHRPEQISCPFHGIDNKPSARYHPEGPNSPSAVYCFVCQERFDAIKLWKKFSGFDGKFSALLRDIERNYNITPPEIPPMGSEAAIDEFHEAELDLSNFFDLTDRRLRNSKPAFQKLDDMKGYLTLGSVIDQLFAQFQLRAVVPATAKSVLRKVLDKIGTKERSCPDV